MLQSISFYASPAPGSRLEEKGYDGEGVLFCDVPDVEAFLRDRLGEKGLILDMIDRISPLTPNDVFQLPPKVQILLRQKGWYMVFRQHRDPPDED